MRTLLALVAAAAMIAAALYVRDGGDGSGLLESPEPARLVCITELATVCDALAGDGVEVTVEEAGETAAALSTAGPSQSPEPEHDAWLTLAPWPTVVAETRQRAALPPLDGGQPLQLARSPLVMVAVAERGAVLDQACPQGLTWRCLGSRAGTPWTEAGGDAAWGPVEPGFAPTLNATGLLVLGQAAADFLGGTDFSARDLEGDAFQAWLTRLGRVVPNEGTAGNTPLRQQLQTGAAGFDVIGTTEAEAAPLLERSPRAGRLALRYPEPLVVADVVLAPLTDGAGADRVRELVEEVGATQLAQAGWRVEGESSAPGVPDEPVLPADSNVPSAGALDALRARWGEIAR